MPEVSADPDTTLPLLGGRPSDLWCEECAAYMTRRLPVLVPAIVAVALVRDLPPPLVALRYLSKVHARHLSGLSLETS